MSVNDIADVANFELGSFDDLTDMQKQMYLSDSMYKSSINNTEYQANKDNEAIPSKYLIIPKKCNRSVDIIEKMSVIPGTTNELNFTLNTKMDFVTYSYMYRAFSKYKVKEKYKDNVQISWCHNLGHNSIDSIELVIDNDSKKTITNTWLDIYSQFFITKDYRKNYRINICDDKYSKQWTKGNVSKQNNKYWGTELDPVIIKVPLPLFSKKTPFPIFLANQSTITIKIKYKTKLSQLLKMRAREDENSEWMEIPVSCSLLQGISENETDYTLAEVPELYSCYSKITEEEQSYWKDYVSVNGYKFYYDDIIVSTYDKLYTSSEPFDGVLSSKTPSKSIFWVAQNESGLKFNNYSNYTTNPLNRSAGDNPVFNVSVKHGGDSSRCKNMDASHFNEMMAFYRFPAVPYEKGYGALVFSYNITGTDADVGPIFDQIKTNLNLTLQECNDTNNDILSTINEKVDIKKILMASSNKSEASKNKYKIYIFTLVIKQLQFSIADKIKVNDGKKKL